MNSVAHESGSFKGLVLGLLQLLAGDLSEKLGVLLTKLDEEVCKESRLAGWESLGYRERTVTTLYGLQLRIRRRGYRRRGPGGSVEYRWPLDETLGLRPEERFCPLVQEMAINLAARMSYREAATFLQTYLQVPISHQEVHRLVQSAGEDREREQQAEVAAVLEQGQVPAGSRAAAVVCAEADGVYIPLQREQSRWAEVKLGVLHEGWDPETPARRRFRLKEKRVWGGIMSSRAFWERGAVRFYRRYDPRKVGRTLINGDGAEWVKEGKHPLPRAECYLGRYHLQEQLRRGLGFAPELLQAAREATPALAAVVRADRRHAPLQVIERIERTEPARWLRGHLPLLASGFGTTPVGRALKHLAHNVSVWDLPSKAQPVPFGVSILPPKTK